ncbi:MAG: BglII/BstYI family type II restriction endonuclease [Gammaproteobacteria bacterium]|nr:BglII/BstYI family type II restriction endonuclease [Gammaproteobacteria bacterium]
MDAELIRGGGGEASLTHRLRQALTERGWKKRKIVIQKTVDGKERSATTHEIDHIRETGEGCVALEIEWNNKDLFYDRDLENFQRLHVEGAISVGIILTRGQSLQRDMRAIVLEFARARYIGSFDDLAEIGVTPTQRQRNLVENSGGEFVAEWARVFVADKFGMATTHWDKLQDRVRRGVGNPCPLVLIGIPSRVVAKTADL